MILWGSFFLFLWKAASCIWSLTSKFCVTYLDRTVRLHIRIDMMLPFKGFWEKLLSIYNCIAVLETFLKSCGLLKSTMDGWGAQLLIGISRFHFPFSVIYSCRKGFWHCIWAFCTVNLHNPQSGDDNEIYSCFSLVKSYSNTGIWTSSTTS